MGAKEQMDVIRSTLRCGGSMMSTLNDILEIAKDRNNTEVIRGRFSAPIPTVLTVAAIGLFAAAESVGLSVDIGPPDDFREITDDMRRIKAIVQNLANNAIKFTPSGGEVRISLAVFDSLQEITDGWAKETAGSGPKRGWRASVSNQLLARDHPSRRQSGTCTAWRTPGSACCRRISLTSWRRTGRYRTALRDRTLGQHLGFTSAGHMWKLCVGLRGSLPRSLRKTQAGVHCSPWCCPWIRRSQGRWSALRNRWRRS
ncbi:unnamed protein product [Ectocarpus sp. 4 AP-2014]